MKRRFTGLASLTALAAIFLALPSFAQTNATVARPAAPFAYDITKEVTISGTVSRVLAKPDPGMIWGSHLMVATPSGTIDASLGRSAFTGNHALSIRPGEQVEIVGMTATLNKRAVFLVRTLNDGNQVYVLRNERGYPELARPRERAGQQLDEKGVQP